MMSNKQMTKMERLQTVLEVYGADASRWPHDDQHLLQFIRQSSRAEALFAEAGALDALLDLSMAPNAEITGANEQLQSRILDDFTNLHANSERSEIPFQVIKNRAFMGLATRSGWITSTLLAACFMFGLYLGGIGIGDWTLDPADSLASLSNTGDQFAEIADFVMASGLGEELL